MTLEAGAWRNSSVLQRGVGDLDNTVLPLRSGSLTALWSLWTSENCKDFWAAQNTVGQASMKAFRFA